MVIAYVKGTRKDSDEVVTGYLMECPDKFPERMHDKRDVEIRSFVVNPADKSNIYEIDSESKIFLGYFNTYAGDYYPLNTEEQ